MRNRRAYVLIPAFGLAAVLGFGGVSAADPAASQPAESSIPLNFDAPAPTQVEMAPTEFGLRFTPGMAKAIGRQMAREMGRQYEFTPEQQEKAQGIIAANMMKLAQQNQRAGREAMELFMENMIANDGSFAKDDGQRWAKLMRPMLADFRESAGQTASQIGQHLTLSQRLKLTRDMVLFSAGISVFDGRLKSWEKGELGEFANPFFEMDEKEEKSRRTATQDAAQDPKAVEVSRAERRAGRRMEFDTNVEGRWKSYVESAIAYYGFSEAQATSARTILKDFLERARQIQSDEWKSRMRRNRTAAVMSGRLASDYRDGPWMWQLDREYEELLRPLQDLGRELRTRVDELADSTQRARAAEKARGQLSDNGYELPPM